MPTAALTPQHRELAPDFARRFAAIAAGLIAVIAHGFLRNPSLAPLIVPLCARLTRAAARCTRLMATLAAGKFPRRRLPRPRDETADQARAPRVRPPIPAADAWLIKILLHKAAVYRYRLETLLAEPGIAEILAAAPTTTRFLRPLCRMLALPFVPPQASEPAPKTAPETEPAPAPQTAASPARPRQQSSESTEPWRPEEPWRPQRPPWHLSLPAPHEPDSHPPDRSWLDLPWLDGWPKKPA